MNLRSGCHTRVWPGLAESRHGHEANESRIDLRNGTENADSVVISLAIWDDSLRDGVRSWQLGYTCSQLTIDSDRGKNMAEHQ